MYFALDEFFLQRTQQYTHIKNLVNAPVNAIVCFWSRSTCTFSFDMLRIMG